VVFMQARDSVDWGMTGNMGVMPVEYSTTADRSVLLCHCNVKNLTWNTEHLRSQQFPGRDQGTSGIQEAFKVLLAEYFGKLYGTSRIIA
jgi:hypothetical protein